MNRASGSAWSSTEVQLSELCAKPVSVTSQPITAHNEVSLLLLKLRTRDTLPCICKSFNRTLPREHDRPVSVWRLEVDKAAAAAAAVKQHELRGSVYSYQLYLICYPLIKTSFVLVVTQQFSPVVSAPVFITST